MFQAGQIQRVDHGLYDVQRKVSSRSSARISSMMDADRFRFLLVSTCQKRSAE